MNRAACCCDGPHPEQQAASRWARRYTLLRAPADAFFPRPQYQALEAALLEFGERELGCRGMSPPWVACYVDGCRQVSTQPRPLLRGPSSAWVASHLARRRRRRLRERALGGVAGAPQALMAAPLLAAGKEKQQKRSLNFNI
jgi:hypothetical protein